MTAITIADLTNAKLDADHIAAIATSTAATATDRLGQIKSTLAAAIDSIKSFTDRGAWAALTVYASKDLVSESGTWYVCVVPHTSSAAFATDTATKWRVYQGLTLMDLALVNAASLVGADDAASGVLFGDVQGYIDMMMSTLGATSLGSTDGNVQADLNNLRIDLGSTATSERPDPIPFTDIEALVTQPLTTNYADPDVTDVATAGDVAPTLTSTANQLHRLRNNTTGVLSAQSSSTLGSFAETRKYNVVEGVEYTISMHGAPTNFYFYFSVAQILTYTSGGVLGTKITSFTKTPASLPREVTFTVPAGSTKISLALRNSTDFSNTVPMTEAALQYCLDNIMLNVGSTSADFAAYSDGVFTPTTALFDPTSAKQITVAKQGTDYYVRTAAQQSDVYDVVWRLRTHLSSVVTDLYGIRFIDNTISHESTIAAFNKSTMVHFGGSDESCPIRLNQMYLAGGHGATAYTVTKAAHGKTAVDVGQIVTDGVDQWVLYKVPSTSTLTYVRRYTGASDKWTISSAAPTGLTFTYVSGGVDTSNVTFTSPTQSQSYPVIRSFLSELRMDNVAITADGVYNGSRLVFGEIYALLNVASQQDYLIANAGAAVPDYVNAAIAEQVRFFYEFEWNEFGAMSVRAGQGVKNAYRRDVGNGYWGGLQLQRLSLVGDSTAGMHTSVWMYAPDIAPVGAFDFKAIANITANAAEVRLPKASCTDVADPASHFALIGKDGGGTILSGHLFGYSRAEGQGVPATRAASVVDCLFFSSSEKMYPIAVDSAAGDSVAGDVVTVTGFRAPYLPTDTDLTVPAVIVSMGGKNYVYITAHTTLANKAVTVPMKFAGQAITVVKASANVTVHDAYVAGGTISISVSGGYGDAVLRLG